MKSFHIRFITDSLIGQLVGITIMGIVMMQVVNYFTVCTIQQKYKKLTEKAQTETIVSLYLLLDKATSYERQNIVRTLGSLKHKNGISLTLGPEAPSWFSENSSETQSFTTLFLNSLRDYGIADAIEVHARLSSIRPSENTGTNLHYEPLLQAMLLLHDGNWLSVTKPLIIDDPKLLWSQRLTVLLELLFFGGIIISLILRVTRPLCRLSNAADAFGRYPEGECPLPEAGSREIREAAQSFNRMRERILNNLSDRQRMLAAMGHDLRTPLTRAKLRLEEIKPQELQEKFASNLSDIQSIVEQGLELAGSLQTSEEPVMLEINAFVESIVDDTASQGKPVKLKVSLNEYDKPLIVFVRPLCLKRCFENLISNALAYGGQADVAISKQSDFVVIEIVDNGPGIPTEKLEKVFEPYYRLEDSRNRESGGTGLGLSIARNMASLNNGRVVLENCPEGGLKAMLTFPKAKAMWK